MTKKIGEIRRKLWKKADQSTDTQLHKTNVEATIKDVAGRHPDTVETYIDEMLSMSAIKRHGDVYTVSEPATQDVEYDGEYISKHVNVPRELVDAADNVGINFSSMLIDAALDAMDSKKKFMASALNENLDELECEVVWRFVKHGVYKNLNDESEKRDRQAMRQEMYRDVYELGDDEKLDIEHYEHIEDLRKEAFRMGEHVL